MTDYSSARPGSNMKEYKVLGRVPKWEGRTGSPLDDRPEVPLPFTREDAFVRLAEWVNLHLRPCMAGGALAKSRASMPV